MVGACGLIRDGAGARRPRHERSKQFFKLKEKEIDDEEPPPEILGPKDESDPSASSNKEENPPKEPVDKETADGQAKRGVESGVARRKLRQ